MKLTMILCTVAALHVGATGTSQLVTLKFTDASPQKVFKEIRRQTGYFFLYKNEELSSLTKISVELNNASVEEAIVTILPSNQFSFRIIDKTIVVTRRFVTGRPDESTRDDKSPPPIEITGTVTNEKGEPLAGATIQEKNGQGVATTDENGNFRIQTSKNEGVILISYVGYELVEKKFSGAGRLDFVLAAKDSKIDEVVVVGYGTQKKINLTGAVDMVSGEVLQNRGASNISQLLVGVSPNLNISLSNRGGEPGAAMSWNIRGLGSISGNSNPLVLVDGVESNMDNLDPETIESVSVLKDASASAIYGSRAPFGVILVTTKKGSKNKGVRIQYNNNISSSSPIRVPEFVDALTWATVYNQAAANGGLAPIYPDEQVERIRKYMEGTYENEYDVDNPPHIIWNGRWQGNANYNWPKMFYRKNSISHRHSVNLQGGDDKTQYFVSGGYYRQGGLYSWGNDGYKRANALANVSSQATKWLRFDFSTRFAQTWTDYPLGIVGTPRSYNLREFITFGPMTPMFHADGKTVINPIVRAFQSGGRDKTTINELLLKAGAEIEPVKGWKTQLNYSYILGTTVNTQTPRPVPVVIPDGTLGNIGTSSSGVFENFGNTNYSLISAVSSYEIKVGEHFIKPMIGYEQEISKYATLNGSRMELISQQVPSINAATGESTVGATSGHWATQAVFGRINYNYKEKFLLEFSGRYNGSSRFAKDARWGLFPSFSAGYNISKENFWNPIADYVNTFKVRGSYGSLGNQNVPNYLYASIIPVFSNLNYIIDNSRPIYAQVPALISSDLTWETVTSLNLGFDATFLSDRLGVTFDWYRRKTTDMFGPSQDFPAVLGTTAPFENNAELQTKGFELSLDWRDRINEDMNYSLRLVLGDNRSKILKYKNDDLVIDTWYDGLNYGDFWGFITDGLIQKAGEPMADQSKYYNAWGPGDMKYKDLDGNNIINDGKRTLNDHGDLTIIGNSSPRYTVGFSGSLNWKNFSFSMFWQGVGKRNYLPHGSANVFYGFSPEGGPGGESGIMKGSPVLDYWRPADETNMLGPNTDAYFPKPYFTQENWKNRWEQSRYVLNAAYLRLKNVQIGYLIPKTISRKVFVETARIYISGENLLTITKLPRVFDPETAFSSDAIMGGLQQASAIYPISRVFSCGVNLTF